MKHDVDGHQLLAYTFVLLFVVFEIYRCDFDFCKNYISLISQSKFKLFRTEYQTEVVRKHRSVSCRCEVDLTQLYYIQRRLDCFYYRIDNNGFSFAAV